MRSSRSRLFRRPFGRAGALVALACLAVVALAPILSIGSEPPLAEDELLRAERLLEILEAGSARVRVIVSIEATPSIADFVAWDDPIALESRRGEVAGRVDSVLDSLAPGDFEVRRRFDHLVAFAAEVTEAGLRRLIDSDDVASIRRDELHEADTRQGIPQIAAESARAAYGGAGVSIAIADTGVDYSHPDLGGGGFPNAKVIGGYDFGDDDSDPMDLYGHGTPVAGIAAGDIASQGDYVGGVAPFAKVYALKISFGSGGIAFTSDMIAAWDWCVTHKYDDPLNPILVVNTSFSDGLWYGGACDAVDPVQTAAADNLVAAGIALFCSSGNGGFCDGMARPACLSSAISVGAAYDTTLGAVGWCVDPSSCVAVPSGCSSTVQCDDWSPSFDQPICFSNSSTTLDLLAPSYIARTASAGGGYQDFSGTSASAPYAAGAAALVQSASLAMSGVSLPIGTLRSMLTTTGDSVVDPKSGIATPRVNVEAALATMIPANDACTDAIPIGDGTFAFTNIGAATDGPDEPGLCFFSGNSQVDADIWFCYTAPCTGQATATTCGADFDTKIAVYDGCDCPDSASAIACDDDSCGLQSIATFDVLAGSSYLIRVGGYLGEQGSGDLVVSCRPANDDCLLARPVSEGSYAFTNINATTDGPDEPSRCDFFGYTQIDSDVWYLYSASCTGVVTVDLCSADYDTKAAVYSGSACPSSASAIACDDDACGTRSIVTFDAVSGGQYLIRVGGYLGEQGSGSMSIGCALPFDDCERAGLLFEGTTPFTNIGATTDGPDEPDACGKYGYTHIDSDIWYAYTAACMGELTVSLCSSDFDTKMAAYRGSECPTTASAIACNDDACGVRSEVTFRVIEGETYLLRIGGFRGEQGTGNIEAYCTPSAIAQCQGIDDVNTLRVNFDNGVEGGFFVPVSVDGPIILDIAKPDGAGNGKFLVHMNEGAPTGDSVLLLPGGLGVFCFPALIQNGATPVCVWNSIGKENKVGSSQYFGTPIPAPGRAPETFLFLSDGDPVNLPLGSSFTLQAIIINPDATSPKGASVTNAVLFSIE